MQTSRHRFFRTTTCKQVTVLKLPIVDEFRPSCLTPVYRRERRFFDVYIPGMSLRNNSSNVGSTSLLQILVVQGNGEGEKDGRKDRK